jgi:hypothetical protein
MSTRYLINYLCEKVPPDGLLVGGLVNRAIQPLFTLLKRPLRLSLKGVQRARVARFRGVITSGGAKQPLFETVPAPVSERIR